MNMDEAQQYESDDIKEIDGDRINNIPDYLVWVKNKVNRRFGIQKSTISPWFRGEANAAWKLKPSLYRCEVSYEFEREILRDFKLYAAEFLDHRERSDIDWLFLAQHYGIPTRLIDWSENPLVALFFAVNDCNTDVDGKIVSINPWELNKSSIDMLSVPTTDSPIFKEYVIDLTNKDLPRSIVARRPIAIRPYHVFRRSNAQSGMFTIHGVDTKALDQMSFVRRNKAACFRSILVNGKQKLAIKKDLLSLGISHSALFQSIDDVAKTIRFRYSREFFR
ncbi:FRG domain-containing protein [Azospirillum sp. SYSU D00513]|uniref:FRG domain-containing protein n=1 Tax=Azospirillum sp. SYSU D00513 TaxID=2812561 RepID=UPI001A960890|nr:FRG domain-containing protein [Azospirillum sp. SYSU D00513]